MSVAFYVMSLPSLYHMSPPKLNSRWTHLLLCCFNSFHSWTSNTFRTLLGWFSIFSLLCFFPSRIFWQGLVPLTTWALYTCDGGGVGKFFLSSSIEMGRTTVDWNLHFVSFTSSFISSSNCVSCLTFSNWVSIDKDEWLATMTLVAGAFSVIVVLYLISHLLNKSWILSIKSRHFTIGDQPSDGTNKSFLQAYEGSLASMI